jgi:hypothetical protein
VGLTDKREKEEVFCEFYSQIELNDSGKGYKGKRGPSWII